MTLPRNYVIDADESEAYYTQGGREDTAEEIAAQERAAKAYRSEENISGMDEQRAALNACYYWRQETYR